MEAGRKPPPDEEMLPKLESGTGMRYVLLHHTGIASPHVDFLLQVPGREGLLTWRIAAEGEAGRGLPERWLEAVAAAVRIPDHRAVYLTYEGELTGNRGSVRRVGAGEAVVVRQGERDLVIALAELPGAELRLPLVLPRGAGKDSGRAGET